MGGTYKYYSESDTQTKDVVVHAIRVGTYEEPFVRDIALMNRDNSIRKFEGEYFQQATEYFESVGVNIWPDRKGPEKYTLSHCNFKINPEMEPVGGLVSLLDIIWVRGENNKLVTIAKDLFKYGTFTHIGAGQFSCQHPTSGFDLADVDSVKAILCIYCREYFSKVFKDMANAVEDFAGSTEALNYKYKDLLADIDVLDRLLKEEGKDILVTDDLSMFLVRGKRND